MKDNRFVNGFGCGVLFCMFIGFIGIWIVSSEPRQVPGIDFPIEWTHPPREEKEHIDSIAAVVRKNQLDIMRGRFAKWLMKSGQQKTDAEIDAIIATTTPDIESRLDPYNH